MSLLTGDEVQARDPALREAVQDMLRERISAAELGRSGNPGRDQGPRSASAGGGGSLRRGLLEDMAQRQARRSDPTLQPPQSPPPGAGGAPPSGPPVVNIIGGPAPAGGAPASAVLPGAGRGAGNPFDVLAGQVPPAREPPPRFPRIMTLPEWASANHPDLARSTMMPAGVKNEMLAQYDRYLATADFMQRSRIGQQRAQIALDNRQMNRIRSLSQLEQLAAARASGKVSDTDFVEGLRQGAAREAGEGDENGLMTKAYQSFLQKESAARRKPDDVDGIEDKNYVDELEQDAAKEVRESGKSDGTAAVKLRLYRDLLRGPQSRGEDRGRPLPEASRRDMIESIQDFGASMSSEKSKVAPDVLWQRIQRMQRILETHGSKADLDNIRRLVEAIKPDPSSILRAYQDGRFGKPNKPESRERVLKLLGRLYPGIAGGAAEKLIDGGK